MANYLNKYFFTGAFLGGGSVYFFEKNQQAKRADLWNRQYKKNDDVELALKNKAANLGQDFRAQAEKAGERTKEYAQDATDKTREVARDSAHDAKHSVLDGVYGVKNAVVHTAEYTKDQLAQERDQARREADRKLEEAKQTKNSWFNWGQQKADEAKNQADYHASNLNSKAQDYKQDANKSLDGLNKQAQETKSSWFGWGEKKTDEAKDQLDESKKYLQNKAGDAKQQAQESKSSWFNWGSKKSEEAQDAINSKYDRFQNELNKSQNDNLDYVKHNIDHGVDKVKKGADDFGSWSKRQVDESRFVGKNLSEEELARINKRGLSGWGESAAQFAADEYDESKGRK